MIGSFWGGMESEQVIVMRLDLGMRGASRSTRMPTPA